MISLIQKSQIKFSTTTITNIEFCNLPLLVEAYHASVSDKYSRSFFETHKHLLINEEDKWCLEQGINDSKKFRSNDGYEVVLPILLLSRYFDFFVPLLSNQWNQEETTSVDMTKNDLVQLEKFLNDEILILKDCETAYSYFGAKIDAYANVAFPVGYDNDVMMKQIGEMLRRSIFSDNLERNLENLFTYCDDYELEDIDYFVMKQDLMSSPDDDKCPFSADFYRRRSNNDVALYAYTRSCLRTGKMDDEWIDMTISVLVEDLAAIPKYSIFFRRSYSELLITNICKKFKGTLDDNDQSILKIIIELMSPQLSYSKLVIDLIFRCLNDTTISSATMKEMIPDKNDIRQISRSPWTAINLIYIIDTIKTNERKLKIVLDHVKIVLESLMNVSKAFCNISDELGIIPMSI